MWADHIIEPYIWLFAREIKFGYRCVSDLIRATDLFDVDMRNGTAMYIRDPKG